MKAIDNMKSGMIENDPVVSEVTKRVGEINEYIKTVDDEVSQQIEFSKYVYVTGTTEELLDKLEEKESLISSEIKKTARRTILLLGMCETYGQKIALLQTKKIVTVETDISVFVTEEYVKNYQMED